jgi:hypothetical protein
VTAELIVQALKRLHPEAVLSCMSAVKLYDRRLDAPPRPHISAPTQIRRAGLVAHQRPSLETTGRHGIGLTTPRQTFLDLATDLEDVRLAVVGDALCRRTALTPDELRRFVESHPPVAGLRRARRVAALVRAGVDSVMETRVRLIVVAAGLPEPLVNEPARDGYGGWLARVDLIYPQVKVGIEFQGDHHRTDRQQWRDDMVRMRMLQDDGWLVLYLSADDVRFPNRFLGQLRNALAARGAI